jgi:hypothetical protein
MATTDIDAIVAEFAANQSCASLELPHMTTGQRKATKKLLEQYPELRCESYGFGPERQLHLFKKGAVQAEREEQKCELTPLGVNVKNTFIDDWAAPKPEAIVFRSLQFRTDGKKTDLPSLEEFKEDSTEKGLLAKPDVCSGAAYGQEAIFLAMDKELQVRNTFIHFDKSVDQRVVQSMPHGMFKQCLLAESTQGATGYETPTTIGCNTPTSASEVDLHELMCLPIDETKEEKRWSLCPGSLVVVEGLVKAAAFNGRSAVVQSYDEETGRYSILLASASGSQEAKIKEENLRVVCPCP